MKASPYIYILFLFLFLSSQKTQAQSPAETIAWLRSNLKTVVVQHEDSILPYKMTKTYSFYDDNFVIKTEKDFYWDTSLNSPPAFSKIWYKDIIPEKEIVFKVRDQEDAHIFLITANPIYYIIGKEEAPLSFWQTFNEPSGLDLYLPLNKSLSTETIKRLMLLAKTETEIAPYSTNIQKRYEQLETAINQQKFLLPSDKSSYIKAELKKPDRLTILESRPDIVQEYTFLLHQLEKFMLLPDTLSLNIEAVHFLLKIKDSILIAKTVSRKTTYIKQSNVIFTLDNPYLIAQVEALLNNICRDNELRKRRNDMKEFRKPIDD